MTKLTPDSTVESVNDAAEDANIRAMVRAYSPEKTAEEVESRVSYLKSLRDSNPDLYQRMMRGD